AGQRFPGRGFLGRQRRGEGGLGGRRRRRLGRGGGRRGSREEDERQNGGDDPEGEPRDPDQNRPGRRLRLRYRDDRDGGGAPPPGGGEIGRFLKRRRDDAPGEALPAVGLVFDLDRRPLLE